MGLGLHVGVTTQFLWFMLLFFFKDKQTQRREAHLERDGGALTMAIISTSGIGYQKISVERHLVTPWSWATNKSPRIPFHDTVGKQDFAKQEVVVSMLI